MIDIQPTMSIQHDAEAERGMAEWQLIEHLNEWCALAKMERAYMHTTLNEAVAPYGFMVVDCQFDWRARR